MKDKVTSKKKKRQITPWAQAKGRNSREEDPTTPTLRVMKESTTRMLTSNQWTKTIKIS